MRRRHLQHLVHLLSLSSHEPRQLASCHLTLGLLGSQASYLTPLVRQRALGPSTALESATLVSARPLASA